MGLFRYRATSKSGDILEDSLEVSGSDALRAALANRGLTLLSFSEENSGFLSRFKFGQGKISDNDLIIFTRQFRVLLRAGLTIPDTLDLISRNHPKENFKQALKNIKFKIEKGVSFSHALEDYPNIFSENFILSIRSSEESGQLEQVIEHLEKTTIKIKVFKGKVVKSLSYPFLMMGVASVIILGMLVFVIPSFKDFFEGANMELPQLTSALIFLGDTLKGYFPFIILGLFGIGFGFKRLLSTPEGKYKVDSFLIKFPLTRGFFTSFEVGKFQRILSLLLGSGVNLVTSIENCRNAMGNHFLRKQTMSLLTDVQSGKSIFYSFDRVGFFPDITLQMIQIGEKSGDIGGMLDHASDILEEDLDSSLETITAFVEPALIVFLGFAIGLIVLALFLPILKMAQQD